MHIDSKQSRRAFLQRTMQLGATGVAAPLVSSLGLIGEAAAQSSGSGYKALVCIFLYGGNDHGNTLVPYDAPSHSAYSALRNGVSLPRTSLGSTSLTSKNSLSGRQYALNPALQPLAPLFAQGKLAPLVNVGALVEPTTKSAYLSKSVRLPPQLFSHNDQQSYMQAFAPEGASAGWGGRMGDLLQASNGNAALTSISLSGRALWATGNSVMPYTAQPNTLNSLAYGSDLFGSSASLDALRALMTYDQQSNWIAQEHARVVTRALTLGDTIANALTQAPDAQFTTFTPGNSLSDELKMVARLIKVGPSLGLSRQVFFVSQGGYDTHSGQTNRHPALLATLGQAMADFYAATVQHGIEDQVTSFTASEFGRSIGDNGDGTDHGWGSHHFVLGGAVNGGAIYGTPPTVGINTNEDVNGGRQIPTTATDQMAATLALWFGVAPADLPLVLPNIVNFNPSSWNLGFV